MTLPARSADDSTAKQHLMHLASIQTTSCEKCGLTNVLQGILSNLDHANQESEKEGMGIDWA